MSSDVVGRLWGFCHTLRHEGVDYGDYIEQITYLLFIKMADERAVALPEDCDWESLRAKSGTELLDFYTDALRTLGKEPGILGDIFSGARSHFTNPVSLKKLLGLIHDIQWTELGVDVKAAAFEGLLEKAASEGKKGAGQYFTPRVLIDSIVRCVKPDPRATRNFAIADPACGTGGFLVSAYEWLVEATQGGQMDRAFAKRVAHRTYFGQDLVARPRRLALMNLYLHGLEPHIALGDTIYDPPVEQRFDVIITNPPFGTRGANQAPDRDDFTVTTANKQLNFLQHILTVLRPGGRAAVVLPDNCLFADQAGAVLDILTQDANLHTILRLPKGTFTPYSPGTKTNVVFFTMGEPTTDVWIYDARTNVPHITKKDRPLTAKHFEEFEKCFGDDPFARSPRSVEDSVEERWRSFSIHAIREREFKIDNLRWLRDDSVVDDTAPPDELIADALEELAGALEELKSLSVALEDPQVQPG
jgi:type I restriction enzyme M protein